MLDVGFLVILLSGAYVAILGVVAITSESDLVWDLVRIIVIVAVFFLVLCCSSASCSSAGSAEFRGRGPAAAAASGQAVRRHRHRHEGPVSGWSGRGLSLHHTNVPAPASTFALKR